MKIVMIGVAVLFSLGLLFILYLVASFIFVGNISELKIRLSDDYKAVDPSVQITDVTEASATPYKDKEREDQRYPRVQYLTEDRKLIDRSDDMPASVKMVSVLTTPNENQVMVLRSRSVAFYQNDSLGQPILAFDDKDKSIILTAYRFSPNKTLILVQKDMTYNVLSYDFLTKKVEPFLENVDYSYSGFVLPLRVFENSQADERVLVYYSKDSYLYGFGGDASRPKTSYVRFYDKTHPKGRLLAEFSYKSGMIVEVEFVGDDLVLTGDRNRPRQVNDRLRPQKKWKLQFKRSP